MKKRIPKNCLIFKTTKTKHEEMVKLENVNAFTEKKKKSVEKHQCQTLTKGERWLLVRTKMVLGKIDRSEFVKWRSSQALC